MKPWGNYFAVDLYNAGGIGLVTKRLIEGGLIDGSAMTVTGRPLGEECGGLSRQRARRWSITPMTPSPPKVAS